MFSHRYDSPSSEFEISFIYNQDLLSLILLYSLLSIILNPCLVFLIISIESLLKDLVLEIEIGFNIIFNGILLYEKISIVLLKLLKNSYKSSYVNFVDDFLLF